MDVAALLSASTDYEDQEEDHSSSSRHREVYGSVRASAAVVAFEPDHHQLSFSSRNSNPSQSISPYARPIATKSVNAKRGLSVLSSPSFTGNSSAGRSSLALTIAPAAPVKTAKALPQPSTKRIRKRKLSAKQMKRWLEKEEEDSQIYNLTLDVNELKQQLQIFELQKSARDAHAGRAPEFQRRRDAHSEPVFQVVSARAARVGRGRVQLHPVEPRRADRARHGGVRPPGAHRAVGSLYDALPDPVVRQLVREPVVKRPGVRHRAAIEAVFPHILHDEELVKRVLSSKFVCPAATLLYFDASGTAVRYDAHADIFEGLNMLLAANPCDVITMMANARIGDANMIPSDREDDDIVSISLPPPQEKRSTVLDGEGTEGDRHSVKFLLS